MSCPLLGQIAVISGEIPTLDEPAVRVRYREHDVILLKRGLRPWDHVQAIMDLTSDAERGLLMYGEECGCHRRAELHAV